MPQASRRSQACEPMPAEPHADTSRCHVKQSDQTGMPAVSIDLLGVSHAERKQACLLGDASRGARQRLDGNCSIFYRFPGSSFSRALEAVPGSLSHRPHAGLL